MSEIRLENVDKRFGKTHAIKDLNLTIDDGEFVVLLGPTGAGKTTTLRLIAGLDRVDGGRIAIDDVDVAGEAPAERDVAFVFQQYSLYPHLTVFENLAFPLRSPARRMDREAIDRRVRSVAEMVRIGHKLENRATRLSGGEMQRVAIGRALVRQPRVFLMDEPLSSLDAKLRAELRVELKRIQNDIGATLLYVTHDQIEAMTMANRIGILAEGRLVQIGTPREIYASPSNVYVAARLGNPHINLLEPGRIPCEGLPDRTRTIGARTEHIEIKRANGSSANGRIEWIEHLGDQNHLHIRAGDLAITTLADPYAGLSAGDDVSLSLKTPLFFDASGERIAAGASS